MNSPVPGSGIRPVIRFAVRYLLFAVSSFVVLELFFRTVLIATESPIKVLGENMILRLEPEYGNSGIFTYGRYCSGGYSWRLNAAGWNSAIEYRLPGERSRSMIAIVGDSYLEGLWSDVDKHIDTYLTDLSPRLDFYTFAIEGACLSQYVAMCQYEAARYEPAAYIVFINDYDLVNSIIFENSSPNQILFQTRVDNSLNCSEVPPSGSQMFWMKNYLRYSATARYIRRNASLGIGFVDRPIEMNNEINLEQQDGQSVIESIDYERACANYLLNRLNSLGSPVLLVMIPRLSSVYSNEDYRYSETGILVDLSEQYENILCCEIGEALAEMYIQNRRPFNPPDNFHWNAYGNRCIASLLNDRIPHLIRACRPLRSELKFEQVAGV